MNVESRGSRGWLPLAAIFVLLLALAGFVLARLRPVRSARFTAITLDSNGTTRLGPLPLSNTNVRDAAFTIVNYLNNGTVAVSAAQSAKMSDLIKTVDAMQRAGVTSVSLRVSGTNK